MVTEQTAVDDRARQPVAQRASADAQAPRFRRVQSVSTARKPREQLGIGGAVARLGLLDGPGNWLQLTLAACAAIGAAPEGLPQFVGVLSPKVAASRLIQLMDEASATDLVFADVDATSCGVAPVSVSDRVAGLERLPYEAWRRKCAEAGGVAGARAVAALPPSGFPSGARRRLREIRSSLVVE